MRQAVPSLPAEWNCEIIGYLYDSEDKDDLSQDMLEVTTPSGVLITAGWEPDGDPHGSYVVRASYGLVELQSVSSNDIDAAQSDVEQLVRRFRVWKPSEIAL